MNIQFNKYYRSGATATTDLHAGGLFFAILYKKCLLFSEDGKVVLTRKLIDPFRPMDPTDVKRIEAFQEEGVFTINGRGYLICHFPSYELEMTGLPTAKDPNVLVFHTCLKRQGGELAISSDVFELDEK